MFLLKIRPASLFLKFKTNYLSINVPFNTHLSTCCTVSQLSWQPRTSFCFYSSNDKKEGFKNPPAQTESAVSDQLSVKKASKRAQLKQAVRDYGATIIVFHVTISLASLGICYLAISNGIDAVNLLKSVGFSESVISSKVAVEGSTFVMSYAVHKLFAPVRIGITLSVAPFIVKYLRKKKWLKPSKK